MEEGKDMNIKQFESKAKRFQSRLSKKLHPKSREMPQQTIKPSPMPQQNDGNILHAKNPFFR